MDRWTGILKIPVYPQCTAHCRIAASLCISPSTKSFLVPTVNAIFFHGDRVEGTGNPVIERLSDIKTVAGILVSKFGASVNAWVIEASLFNGPFAIYKEFIPSVDNWGNPQYYKADGFPASTSVTSLLSNFLKEVAKSFTQKEQHQTETASPACLPKTVLLGFSKGGVVLNQLVTELGFGVLTGVPVQPKGGNFSEVIPSSAEGLLNSISEIHYVDVGLNSPGAYLTDETVVKGLSEQLIQEEEREMRFVLHGTPRQWKDRRRPWICQEKDRLRRLLESQGEKTAGKLRVCERYYFPERPPDLQTHFEIIEKMVVG